MGRDRNADRAAMMMARGADWASVVAQSFRPLDQDLVREKMKQEQAKQLRRYDRRKQKLVRRSAIFGVGAVVLLGSDVVNTPAHLGPAVALGVGGVALGGLSVRSLLRRRNLRPPTPTPLPPPSLPLDAIGASEAAHLAHVRNQLASMVSTVADLHPDAGAELQRADREAGQAFGPLVERLQVLDRIRRQMPGGPAAESATESAQGIARRLADGVDAYERLLASAATMLGSPDIVSKGITDDLASAAQALTAYSHGLGVAAPDQNDHTLP